MGQSLLRTFFYWTLGLAVLISSVSAKNAKAITLDAVEDEVAVILRQTAMPKMGLDRLGSILTRCYNVGFGGPDNWAKVHSLRVSGQLTIEAGEFEFNSYQKKPHYLKMTIQGRRGAMQAGGMASRRGGARSARHVLIGWCCNPRFPLQIHLLITS